MGAGDATLLERLVESHDRRHRRRDELDASGPAFWQHLIWDSWPRNVASRNLVVTCWDS